MNENVETEAIYMIYHLYVLRVIRLHVSRNLYALFQFGGRGGGGFGNDDFGDSGGFGNSSSGFGDTDGFGGNNGFGGGAADEESWD